MLSDALTAARAIEDSDHRARALGELAPHLPAELGAEVLSDALTAARAIEDSYARVRSPWRAGAAPAKRSWLAEVLSEALTAARAIEDSDHRAYALGGLAPYLPAELLFCRSADGGPVDRGQRQPRGCPGRAGAAVIGKPPPARVRSAT